MTHLVIQLKKVLEGGSRESVTSAFIKKLYDYANDVNLVYLSTDLKGDLSVDKTYLDYIDYLTTKYPGLDILATSTYIYFGDNAVESYWANTAYGDGIGITSSSAATITLISNSPFFNNNNITNLDGMLYFINCTDIGGRFAQGATGLTSFVAPPNLLILSDPYQSDPAFMGAFKGCTSLSHVVLNEGLLKITCQAFRGCTSLQTIDIPSTVTHLATNSELTNGSYAVFSECTSLTTVTGGENVIVLGNSTFNGCTSLTSLPDFQFENMVAIGDLCFVDCPVLLGELYLPNLTKVGIAAFAYSTVTKIKSLGHITAIPGDNGWEQYRFCSHCNLLTEVDLSTTTSLTTIGERAFLNCPNLEIVKLPSSVTTIKAGAFWTRSSVLTWNITWGNLTTIESNAFKGCTSLSVPIDLSSCTSLGESAFMECTSLPSVTLSTNLTTLARGVFKNCTSLTSIDLSNISTIGGSSDYDIGAFLGCTNLQTVTGLSSIGYIAGQTFKGCSNLGTGLDLVLNLTENGGSEAFYGTAFRSVVVNGSNCTNINGMFYNMPNCTIFDFSNTKITRTLKFGVRTSLKTIVYPDTLNYIPWEHWDYNSTNESLEYFIILATTPPSYENVTYCKIKNGNFYVPDSAVNDYKSAWPQTSGTLSWDIHAHIKPLSELPVGVWKTGLYQSYEPYLSNSSDPAYA